MDNLQSLSEWATSTSYNALPLVLHPPQVTPPRSRSPSLPSWYHRILEYPDNTVSYEDFDEDISELSESESEPKHGDYCGCGCIPYEEGSECGSGSDQEGSKCDESESESESDSIGSRVGCSDWDTSDDERDETRSRAGREYDYYYELKEQREQRKRQIKQEAKDGESTMKEQTRQTELRIEKKVKKVYHQVRHQRGRRENLVLRGKIFDLGSLNHWQYAYLGHTVQFMSKYVSFDDYSNVRHDGSPSRPPPGQRPELRGQLYMHESTACYFSGPAPPPRPGLKNFVVRYGGGEQRIIFQFVDNHHLIMKVPREVVFGCHPRKMPPNTPRIFIFYGVEVGCEE